MDYDGKIALVEMLGGRVVNLGGETSIVGLSAKGQELIEFLEIDPATMAEGRPEEYVVSEAEAELRVKIILEDLEQDNLLVAEGPDVAVYTSGNQILTNKPDEVQSFINDEYNFRYNYNAWLGVRRRYKWEGMSERQEREAFSSLKLSWNGDHPLSHPNHIKKTEGGSFKSYTPDGVDDLSFALDIYHSEDCEFCGRCGDASGKPDDIVDVNGMPVCTQCFEIEDLDYVKYEEGIIYYSFAVEHALGESSWFLLLEASKEDGAIAKVMNSLYIEMSFIAMYDPTGTGVQVWVLNE